MLTQPAVRELTPRMRREFALTIDEFLKKHEDWIRYVSAEAKKVRLDRKDPFELLTPEVKWGPEKDEVLANGYRLVAALDILKRLGLAHHAGLVTAYNNLVEMYDAGFESDP